MGWSDVQVEYLLEWLRASAKAAEEEANLSLVSVLGRSEDWHKGRQWAFEEVLSMMDKFES
jgi:hypothetical protein